MQKKRVVTALFGENKGCIFGITGFKTGKAVY